MLRYATAFLGYCALAILLTFPLVLHLPSRVTNDLGDPLMVLSALWWNLTAVPLSERWWDGFGFFPAAGMMAFSDHHFGASILAAPVLWLTANPIAAYNVVFLASWALCAIAAHGCAVAITSRHDAGLVAGLAYGFNPYRIAHLEHLELLLAFGMPFCLAALHRYRDTRRPAWAVAFGAGLVVQALSNSYYSLFFTVFFALWVAWFMRPAEWRQALPLAAAGAAAVAVVSPIFLGYRRVHQALGVDRAFREVLLYSADLSSFVTASERSWLWRWTSSLNGTERELFPGLTIVVLVVAAWLWRRRTVSAVRDRWLRLSRACWVAAAIALLLAVGAIVIGPWQIDWGWMRLSVSAAYKPMSVALALAILAVALRPGVREAFRQRSALAFYVAAAVVFLLCSLGPEPRLLGERMLYEPPYAWLMRLPFFGDTVRVPARFGMLAVLALSLAAGIAFARLTGAAPRRLLLAVVVAGVIADGWAVTMALPAPPPTFSLPRSDVAAVLELPLGAVLPDTAAMYRATVHGIRTVNGYNGYDPRYYHVLRLALADRDATVLDALAEHGAILVATDAAADATWTAFVGGHPAAIRASGQGRWSFFFLPARQRAELPCAGPLLPLAGVTHRQASVDAVPVTDADARTRWISAGAQRAGDDLTLDLGRPSRVCGVVLSLGPDAELYPRTLVVSTSVDGVQWTTGADLRMGGATLRAALDNPRDARITLPLPAPEARFVRLELRQTDPIYPWAVADIVVVGTPGAPASGRAAIDTAGIGR